MNYPNILVISNNCFSLSDSNGRTLGNLFHGWPKEHLAQMCVIAKDPNWELCDKYYCIEDRAMLSAFLHSKKCDGHPIRRLQRELSNDEINTKRSVVGKKTIIKVILREFVWARKRWKSKDFINWVNEFNPNVIVLQFGDTCFMIEITMFIAKTKKIPLIIYNTEGYYFFPRNWYYKSGWDWLFFPGYKNYYHKKVESLMETAVHSVYVNNKLKEDYDSIFHKPSTVIFNSSNLIASEKAMFQGDTPQMAYLGNLGLDRDSALIEVGEVLQQLSTSYYIDIYGGASEDVEARLRSAQGVRYHGRVSYEEVKKIISESDILFHAETEKGYKERQLQYAFSTKIADSVASGRCFVIYAPKELACYQYIRNTGAGWVAKTKTELMDVLTKIMNNSEERTAVINNAIAVASMNHSFEKNANRFQEILLKECQ